MTTKTEKPVIALENRAWKGVRAYAEKDFPHFINNVGSVSNFEIINGWDGFYVTVYDILGGTGEHLGKFKDFWAAITALEERFGIKIIIKDAEKGEWVENIKYSNSEIKRRRALMEWSKA